MIFLLFQGSLILHKFIIFQNIKSNETKNLCLYLKYSHVDYNYLICKEKNLADIIDSTLMFLMENLFLPPALQIKKCSEMICLNLVFSMFENDEVWIVGK